MANVGRPQEEKESNERIVRIGNAIEKLPIEIAQIFTIHKIPLYKRLGEKRFTEDVKFTYIPLNADVDNPLLPEKLSFEGRSNLLRLAGGLKWYLYVANKKTDMTFDIIYQNQPDLNSVNESFALKWKLSMVKRRFRPLSLYQKEFEGMLTFYFDAQGLINHVQVDHMVPPLPSFLKSILQSTWWTTNPSLSYAKKTRIE
jgi:hypothetical protein